MVAVLLSLTYLYGSAIADPLSVRSKESARAWALAHVQKSERAEKEGSELQALAKRAAAEERVLELSSKPVAGGRLVYHWLNTHAANLSNRNRLVFLILYVIEDFDRIAQRASADTLIELLDAWQRQLKLACWINPERTNFESTPLPRLIEILYEQAMRTDRKPEEISLLFANHWLTRDDRYFGPDKRPLNPNSLFELVNLAIERGASYEQLRRSIAGRSNQKDSQHPTDGLSPARYEDGATVYNDAVVDMIAEHERQTISGQREDYGLLAAAGSPQEVGQKLVKLVNSGQANTEILAAALNSVKSKFVTRNLDGESFLVLLFDPQQRGSTSTFGLSQGDADSLLRFLLSITDWTDGKLGFLEGLLNLEAPASARDFEATTSKRIQFAVFRKVAENSALHNSLRNRTHTIQGAYISVLKWIKSTCWVVPDLALSPTARQRVAEDMLHLTND
jgi:hypothetical protein